MLSTIQTLIANHTPTTLYKVEEVAPGCRVYTCRDRQRWHELNRGRSSKGAPEFNHQGIPAGIKPQDQE